MERATYRAILARLTCNVAVVLLVLSAAPFVHTVHADTLAPRSFTVSDDLGASHNVTYKASFTTMTIGLMGSIRIEFCSNSPLVDDTCTPPFGLDVSGVILSVQGGTTGFALAPTLGDANNIVLSRVPTLQPLVSAHYDFINATNPSSGGSYFARIFTYPTSDGSGLPTDSGGTVFDILPSLAVSAEVPPYLRFCVGESITNFDCTTATEPFSDVGVLGPLVTGVAQSQLVAATNASSGYSMWVFGGTMASGNNIIPALAVDTASQKGAGQFGLNLRANTAPVVGQDPAGPGLAVVNPLYAQQNQYRFQSGDTLASTNAPDDNRKYTVSYIVNVPANQPGGVYATTLTYIVLANF